MLQNLRGGGRFINEMRLSTGFMNGVRHFLSRIFLQSTIITWVGRWPHPQEMNSPHTVNKLRPKKMSFSTDGTYASSLSLIYRNIFHCLKLELLTYIQLQTIEKYCDNSARQGCEITSSPHLRPSRALSFSL